MDGTLAVPGTVAPQAVSRPTAGGTPRARLLRLARKEVTEGWRECRVQGRDPLLAVRGSLPLRSPEEPRQCGVA